jgi:adenine-specific DNA-methyltransferase
MPNSNRTKFESKEIAKRQPLRAVFRDSSFSASPEKINVEEISKLLAPNTSVKVL